MFSFSLSRPKGAGAKRSIGRSLSSLGLLACFAVVAGTGCGGSNNNSTDNGSGGTDTGVTPIVTANNPSLRSSGTRGTIPIGIYPFAFVSTVPAQYFVVSPTESKQLPVPSSSFIGAPNFYADRQFSHFELNGTRISAGTPSQLLERETVTTLSLAGLPPTLNGTLTAVYVPYNPGAGVPFTPNYNQTNYARWDSMPVKVYLDRAITPNEGVRQRVIAAMDKWVRATGGVISYTLVQDDGTADISFYVADSLAALNPENVEVLAITNPQTDGSNPNGLRRLVKANIYGVAAKFNSQSGGDQLQFEQVMAHEFGHALGISSDTAEKSHSPNAEDLMYPAVNDIIGELTSSDIGTIANMYRAEFEQAAAASRSK